MDTNFFSNNAYAPADFDGDNQPLAIQFDMSGHGNDAAYTTATNTVIANHIGEIKQKTAAELPKPTDWKKRLREFLSRKNTDLLDFINVSVQSHPTLGKGDMILRKFNSGRVMPNVGAVKDAVLDLSGGADVFTEIRSFMTNVRSSDPIVDFSSTVQYIYEEYRKAGDAILRAETSMKVRLEVFDKIQKNIVALLELDPTTVTEELLSSSEKYLGDIFEKNKIEPVYVELVEAYRRFVIFREFVQMLRVVQSNENEPLCTICLENMVTHCLNPCGHTYCETCLKRQVSSCFMCRAPMTSRIKLFFG
jgi:hypothetical protein